MRVREYVLCEKQACGCVCVGSPFRRVNTWRKAAKWGEIQWALSNHFEWQAASHQSHQSSSYTNQRTHCYDHQSQLPAPNESNHEAKHKSGDPLNEDRHLVSNGIVNLVDVTGRGDGTQQRHCVKHSFSHTLITAWSADRASTHSDILVFSSPTELQSNHPISIRMTFRK